MPIRTRPWWMVVCWLGVAASAPAPVALSITVVPDPGVWRPAGMPRSPRPAALVPGEGDIVVDGVIDEPAWDRAVPRALEPLADGGVPPSTSLAVAAGPAGVGLRVVGLTDGTATVLVDPDGAGAPWWTVTLTDDVVSWSRCDVPEDIVGAVWPVSPRSLPCTPIAPLPAARGVGGWELLLPTEATERATSALSLMWSERSGRGEGGTLLPSGAVPDLPVVPLRTPFVALLTHAVDCGAGVVRLSLEARRAEAEGPWRWRRVRNGLRIEEGELTVSSEAPATWTVPLGDTPLSTVVVEQASDGAAALPLALTRDIGPAACTVAVSTPMAGAVLELAYDVVAGVPGREVVLTTPAGAVLGRGAVDLPEGSGVLRVGIPASWAGDVRVTVAPWLDDVVVARTQPVSSRSAPTPPAAREPGGTDPPAPRPGPPGRR